MSTNHNYTNPIRDRLQAFIDYMDYMHFNIALWGCAIRYIAICVHLHDEEDGNQLRGRAVEGRDVRRRRDGRRKKSEKVVTKYDLRRESCNGEAITG